MSSQDQSKSFKIKLQRQKYLFVPSGECHPPSSSSSKWATITRYLHNQLASPGTTTSITTVWGLLGRRLHPTNSENHLGPTTKSSTKVVFNCKAHPKWPKLCNELQRQRLNTSPCSRHPSTSITSNMTKSLCASQYSRPPTNPKTSQWPQSSISTNRPRHLSLKSLSSTFNPPRSSR